MLNQHRYYYLIFLSICLSCTDIKTKNEIKERHFPDLDQISGQWVAADTIAMEPSVRNFRGQAVVNRDLTSISWFASAPFSGGYHTGVFKINGEIPLVSMFRWQPYQALRKSQWKSYELISSTRMLPEEDGILWRIEIHNNGQATDTLDIDLDAIGFISKYEGEWQWWYPFPKMNGMVTNRDEEVEAVRKSIGVSQTKEVIIDELVEGKPTGKKMSVRVPLDTDILNATKYKAQKSGNSIIIHDNETEAVTGFTFKTVPDNLSVFNSGGTARWRLPISAGESKIIEYVMTYGDSETVVKENLTAWSGSFDKKFDHVKNVWENRWAQMFQPNNELLSGTFPVLETTDTLVKRVYYTGPL